MEGLIVWVALSNVVGVLIESPVIRQNFSRYVRACKGPKSRAERQEEKHREKMGKLGNPLNGQSIEYL